MNDLYSFFAEKLNKPETEDSNVLYGTIKDIKKFINENN